MSLNTVETAKFAFLQLHPDGILPLHPETQASPVQFYVVTGGGQLRIIFETADGQAFISPNDHIDALFEEIGAKTQVIADPLGLMAEAIARIPRISVSALTD